MRFLSKIFIPTEQNPRFHRFLSKMRISTEQNNGFRWINSQSWLSPNSMRWGKTTVVHCSTVEKHVENCRHNFWWKTVQNPRILVKKTKNLILPFPQRHTSHHSIALGYFLPRTKWALTNPTLVGSPMPWT